MKKKLLFIALILNVFIIMLSLGFASFSRPMTVDNILAIIKAGDYIEISNVYHADTTTSLNTVYGSKTIRTVLDLPNQSASTTFEVEITNISSYALQLDEIQGLPSNITYTITDKSSGDPFTLGDSICDETKQSNNCRMGVENTYYITFSYKPNGFDGTTSHNVDLTFVWGAHFTVIFHDNIDPLNEVTIRQNIPYNVSTNLRTNTFTNGNSTFSSWNTSYDGTGISYIDGEAVLNLSVDGTPINLFAQYNTVLVAYFKEFSGANDFFGETKADIKTFSRDTTSTAAQIQAMANKTLISNTVNGAYLSDYDIYGYLDANGNYKWWSEATKAYLHPDTRKMFYSYSNLKTVDLTDIDTSLVKNFSHFFDTDLVLTTITGKINTSGLDSVNNNFDYAGDSTEGPSSDSSLAFMFNDCKKLTSVDISEIDTSNATDMKRMFAGCIVLPSIDVSHFDTSNVRSMYWMFRNMQTITEIDLSNFDTSNVQNMTGMFLSAKNLGIITLGDNFNTSNVSTMNRMFNGAAKLTTIFADHDFQVKSGLNSSNMFTGDTLLVGEAGKSYETPFNSSKTNIAYAKIATSEQRGYFTQKHAGTKYTLTYNLDGGSATNITYYYIDSDSITLNNPTKTGYSFIGWTGTGLSGLTMNVTIPTGSTGDREYTANYQANSYAIHFDANGGTGTMNDQYYTYGVSETLTPNAYTKTGYHFVGWNTAFDRTGDSYWDEEEIVYSIPSGSITLYAQWVQDGLDDTAYQTVFLVNGTCNFNGETGNITGNDCINTANGANTSYTDTDYINTGIQLYTSANINKDFEIYMEISNYSQANQSTSTNQHTILNSKYENINVYYPGFTLRRSATNNYFEFTNSTNNVKEVLSAPASSIQQFKIIRKNNKLFYQINNGNKVFFQDIGIVQQIFSTPVTFGASLDSSNNPWRKTKVTLSNMHIKIGKYGE